MSQVADPIDIADAVMTLIFDIKEIKRLDINISIGMLSRIIIFSVVYSFRDLGTYTIIDLISLNIGQFFFYVYIYCYEKDYFLNNNARRSIREKSYKLMETFQLVLGVTFFALSAKTGIDIGMLVFFIFQLLLNQYQLFKLLCKKTNQKVDKLEGGHAQMFVGFWLGASTALILIIFSAINLLRKLEDTDSLKYELYFTIIGECFYCFFQCFIITPIENNLKRLLYGANLGLFSIVYGYFTCVVAFFYLIYLMCKACNNSNRIQQVHSFQ